MVSSDGAKLSQGFEAEGLRGLAVNQADDIVGDLPALPLGKLCGRGAGLVIVGVHQDLEAGIAALSSR